MNTLTIIIIIGFIILLWLLFRKKKEEPRTFSDYQKKEILKRQGYTCATCPDNDWRLFEFHHKKAYAEGGETSINNGCALCSKCHTKITRNYK